MPTATKSRRRLTMALALMLLVGLSVAVTWAAASKIRSPAEVAARTLAPEPSPILVPVESRIISTDVVTRGTGRFGSPQTLATVPSPLKASDRFIDTIAGAGSELAEGDVVAVVSGRPVILLVGDQPAFRDLGPGMTGSDVLQFEEALERLGFPPGDVDGLYDLETQFAVAEWYRFLGYQPLLATADQRAQIRSIETDIAVIRQETLAAADGLAVARAELIAAQQVHRAAGLAAASADVAISGARAEAEAANAAAEGDVKFAEGEVALAWRQLPPLWAPDEDHNLAYAQLDNLRVAVATAQANADLTRATGQAAIRNAEVAAAAAPQEVANAAAMVLAAEERVQLANQAVGLAAAPGSRLETDLELAQERSGVQVPADEVIFVPSAPVRVAEVQVGRGDPAGGLLMSVTDAVIAIDGTLALDQVALVKSGMSVTIDEPDLGISATGTVNLIAASPGTRGADGFHVWFETLVDHADSPAEAIVGASVRLTLAIESTGGSVLAVPASALSLAVDGSSNVIVDRAGTLVSVAVEPGLSAGGYVGIEPLDGDLAIGDLVVIGFDNPAAANE